MKWLLILAFVLIMTWAIMGSMAHRDMIAQRQDSKDNELQVAIDMLKDFPTAAGKKK